jgi:hypothetical protein
LKSTRSLQAVKRNAKKIGAKIFRKFISSSEGAEEQIKCRV